MGQNETRMRRLTAAQSGIKLDYNTVCAACSATDGRYCRCTSDAMHAAGKRQDMVKAVDPFAGTLLGYLTKLGPRGLAVLTAIAARLAKGAAEHGDFPNLDRDWTQEALEEDLDGIIYRTVETMHRAGKL